MASVVLVAVGLYVRLGILETPVFARLLEERRTERYPSLSALLHDWREWLTVMFMRLGDQPTSTLINTFIVAYAATLVLHVPQRMILTILLVSAGVALVAIPFFGYLSDHIGRKRLYAIGLASIAVWALPYWTLMDTREPALMLLASMVGWLTWSMLAGAQAALFAEMFTRRRRYSGVSFGYQLAALPGGFAVSLIAPTLVAEFGPTGNAGTALAIYIMAMAVISLVATAFARDRREADIAVEYDDRQAKARPAIG
jgi:MFS family permease